MRAFWKRKHKVAPGELAQGLLTEFVDNASLPAGADLPPDRDIGGRYQARVRLYRLALVLMVLMVEEQSNSRFSAVRKSLEGLVFTMPQEVGMPFLEDLRTAMQDLNELLSSSNERRELSWARAWFQAIGMDETNPVDLALFAVAWMDAYVAVTKGVRDLNPA